MSNIDLGIEAHINEEFELAFGILYPLAEAGNSLAQRIIGQMYLIGQFVVANDEEAYKWYRFAAEQGDFIAQHNLAVWNISTNPEESLRLHLLAAEQGFAFSQESLGNIYSGEYKSLSEFRNIPKAIEWYKKASEHGSATSCYRLGQIYSDGEDVVKDNCRAIKWFKKGAELGHAPCKKLLADAYKNGLLGVSVDDEQAKYWLNRLEESESNK